MNARGGASVVTAKRRSEIYEMSKAMLLHCQDVAGERQLMGKLRAAVLFHGDTHVTWNLTNLNLTINSVQLPLMLQLRTPAEVRIALNLENAMGNYDEALAASRHTPRESCHGPTRKLTTLAYSGRTNQEMMMGQKPNVEAQKLRWDHEI